MAQDSKQRNKVFLETYLTDANLTKDDDTTEINYVVMYDLLPYSPVREFVLYDDYCLMYLLGDPVSTPHYNADKTVDYYEETIPVTISCIDKTGVTASRLKWKAEHELRRLCEEHPFGSIRLMDTRRDTTQRIGATVIYQTEFTLSYRRGPG